MAGSADRPQTGGLAAVRRGARGFRQPARSRLDCWKKRNGWKGLLLMTTALSRAARSPHYLVRARAVVSLCKNARLWPGRRRLTPATRRIRLCDVEESASRRGGNIYFVSCRRSAFEDVGAVIHARAVTRYFVEYFGGNAVHPQGGASIKFALTPRWPTVSANDPRLP